MLKKIIDWVIDLKRILFRCDSSSKIGLGHVKRCLLLANRLKEQKSNLEISFASLDLNGNINEEITKNSFSIYVLKNLEIEELSNLIAELEIDLLIIDSYDIDYIVEKELKRKYQKLKILSFDDTLQNHKSDLILNHGVQAKKSDYKSLIPKSSKALCGSEYTLLRDEFFEKYNSEIVKESIAIILGGNDVLNLSSKIADLLLEINKKYKITIITTSVNPNITELQKRKDIELLVDIENIASIIASKSFVITASGGTLFEVLALKKKFINIEVAPNQKDITKFLEEKSIKTTIKAEELSIRKLEKKIDYIKKKYLYKKLDFKFSKDKLVKKILKELT